MCVVVMAERYAECVAERCTSRCVRFKGWFAMGYDVQQYFRSPDAVMNES